MIQKIKAEFNVISMVFTDSIKTIFTDSGALLILMFAAIFYPVVYSIAYKNEVLTEIPVVVVDYDNTTMSRQWCKMIDATPQIHVSHKASDMLHAQEIFWQGAVNAVLEVPKGFEKDIYKGTQASVGMYADGSNFLLYKETFKSINTATGTLSAGIEMKRLMAKGSRSEQAMHQIQPIKTSVYNLYNPSGGYGSFVMPGIMLIIIQQTLLIGIGLVGGAGRERKRDKSQTFGINLEKHAASVIMGKSMAYFIIGFFNIIFATLIVYHWFSFPSKGMFSNVLILAVPFLLSVIFMGMAISLLFKHRENSIMFLVFLSPVILFVAGLSWPVSSIPPLIHQIFKIFPSTYMVPSYLRLRTMGVSLHDIKPELAALTFQMILYYIIAVVGFKISMKKGRPIA